MDDKTDDCDAAMEEASVVTGTGIAVVPLEPVDVLSVYAGAELVATGTGTTVGPEAPVTVLEV
jgi:hypothetical protein